MSNLLVAADKLEDRGNSLCETLREYVETKKSVRCGNEAFELQRKVLELTQIDVSEELYYTTALFCTDDWILCIVPVSKTRLYVPTVGPTLAYVPESPEFVARSHYKVTEFSLKRFAILGETFCPIWVESNAVSLEREAFLKAREVWFESPTVLGNVGVTF